MCRLAIYRMPMTENMRLEEYQREKAAAEDNLAHLGASARGKSTIDLSGDVVRERTFKLARFMKGTESADFFVLMGSDGKSKTFRVEDVKFISGSAKMKAEGERLKRINFDVPAPSNVPARFIWRGFLGCYQYTGCSFVVLDPGSVQPLN
jgi:hypothetical protein